MTGIGLPTARGRFPHEGLIAYDPCCRHRILIVCSMMTMARSADLKRNVIPWTAWTEPYMGRDELRKAMDDGVASGGTRRRLALGCYRHATRGGCHAIWYAYVAPGGARGDRSRLLSHLRSMAERPMLIGAWADAGWAISFYEKAWIDVVSSGEKKRLLNNTGSCRSGSGITSVVLPMQRGRRHKARKTHQF